MRKIAFAGYIVVAVLEILSLLFSWTALHHFVKPLLMIVLYLYYRSSLPAEQRAVVVMLALLFSFLGDSFLLYEAKNPLYFMLGLGSFLIAHLFYIFAFSLHRYAADHNRTYGIQKARMAFPVILAVTGLVVVLLPRLGELRLPVLLYSGVLLFMVLNAMFRYQQTSSASYWRAFAGALLFLISDSAIAINKFLEPVLLAGPIIMITYISAQWLIIEGLIRHTKQSV